MRDGVGVRGYIRVIERDARTGLILDDWWGSNRVVNGGLDLIAERLRGNTGVGGLSDYALGTDSTPATAIETALVAEAYRGTITQTRVSAGELTITLFLGSTQGNGVTYREGGAFNAQNTMLCRGVFPDKAKTALKTLTVIHTIPLTAS
jgi:hypothetical protein